MSGRAGTDAPASRPAKVADQPHDPGADRHHGWVGALVTVELPDESPAPGRPWIITFGPLGEDDDWEPVVCGPYERPHALALAEAVVADEDLVAVVEPLLPHTTVDEIRTEIESAKLAGETAADEGMTDEEYVDEFTDIGEVEPREAAPLPTPDEVRAGFRRIAAQLTADGA